MNAADRRNVIAAGDAAYAAVHLMNRFDALVNGLQLLGVDAVTLGEAADLADAQQRVVHAIGNRDRAKTDLDAAQGRLAAAQTALARAQADAARASTDREQAAAGAAVTAAQAEAEAAEGAVAGAAARYETTVRVLAAAIRFAAELADKLRRGLTRRHGGIHEAATSSPAPMADAGFYQ